MFERFTKQARESVIAAQEEARTLKATQILPVHVLLGAVATAEASPSPLASVLTGYGLTPAQLRADLQAMGQDAGFDDAAALESVGIDLDEVRRAVEAQFGEGALNAAEPSERRRGLFGSRKGGHIPYNRGAKAVLENSLRESIARKDGYIGTEHLLLGVLRGADPAALSLVSRHVQPEELRARITGTMDAAA
ncbi:Clp protease N-terminal domain-containing protein [Arthrobacter sp. zg-Y877]|uniref:Clp protease N-terminal domain-containing protein n=1 Tax=Arthrobacter sp. zg-Y877 TaxID=3049074 RepID=UPI0025A4B3A9|nr:Clp protease N-terminal domain-containing protein [Arthrobacter sp. zg-Y877]MDM7991565.1 Clp protease N-terminal domain-containing protein [Arthrobacter sp. zg-Y877]